MMRRLFIKFIASVIFIGIITGSSWAVDTCVICDEPKMTYVCHTTSAPEHKIFLQNHPLMHLACIKKIAHDYSHSSCKAKQTTNNQVCTGQLVIVDVSLLARQYINRVPKPLQPTTQSKSLKPSTFPQQQTPPSDQPKTVIELAKRTAQISQKQLDKAGKVVKNASDKAVQNASKVAEKTWQCLSSFFQDC